MRGRRSRFRLRWLKHRRNVDGSVRVYVCVPGRKPVRLPTLPENDPDFIAAYQAAVAEAPRAGRPQPRAGTLEALAQSYRQSATWRGLARSSREQRERALMRLIDKAGSVRVTSIAAKHIRADLAPLTPGAASNRLKAWRALMAHAVDAGLIERSPAADVKPARSGGGGRHSWTAGEIEAFRKHWATGTEQRLAMELAFWTGARRSDLVGLGRQHVGRDGWLTFKQRKTGGEVAVPLTVLPAGCAALSTDHAQMRAALAHGSNLAAASGASAETWPTHRGLRGARSFGARAQARTAPRGVATLRPRDRVASRPTSCPGHRR